MRIPITENRGRTGAVRRNTTQLNILCFGAFLAMTSPVSGQTPKPEPLSNRDVSVVGGAVALYALPAILSWNQYPPSCAPCERTNVPVFDRWIIRDPDVGMSRASNLTLLALGAAGWIDFAGEGPAGASAVVASMESVLWAHALTNVLKNAVRRKPPVLYTDLATDVVLVPADRRSFPSGHTSVAFAVATSYWLSRHNTTGDKPWLRWGLIAGATGVGILRVAAAKHFPSDAVMGAAVGVASAVVVHRLKF